MSDLFQNQPANQADHPEMNDQEMQELAGLVVDALMKGESREKIVGDLVNNGWESSEADDFVTYIEFQMIEAQESAQSHQGGGGEGWGWLIWIGALLLINFLSYVFNWGFWIY